ncbi:hypothetical protein KJ877_10240 [bacterium]|nr:hypothetical protein [bacterium]MBU1991130.1 hypothetical protein [bacterium]
MKKITLSLLAVSTLVFGSPFHNADTTDGDTLIINQTVVNDVVSDAPKVDFVSSDKTVGVTAQYIYSNDISLLNVPVGLNIGSNFGLEVNIPLVSVKVASTTESGLGDISVGGNFHFGKPWDPSGTNITTLLYKTTTGDKDKVLGSGYEAFTLSHRITKDIDTRYQVNGLLSYTVNDEMISGNSYMVMAGGSMPCLFWDKVKTSAKVTYFGVDAVNGFGELKSGNLWLSWNSSKIVNGVPLGLGVKIPLLEEIDGVEKDKTVLFYLSASSFF